MIFIKKYGFAAFTILLLLIPISHLIGNRNTPAAIACIGAVLWFTYEHFKVSSHKKETDNKKQSSVEMGSKFNTTNTRMVKPLALLCFFAAILSFGMYRTYIYERDTSRDAECHVSKKSFEAAVNILREPATKEKVVVLSTDSFFSHSRDACYVVAEWYYGEDTIRPGPMITFTSLTRLDSTQLVTEYTFTRVGRRGDHGVCIKNAESIADVPALCPSYFFLSPYKSFEWIVRSYKD